MDWAILLPDKHQELDQTGSLMMEMNNGGNSRNG